MEGTSFPDNGRLLSHVITGAGRYLHRLHVEHGAVPFPRVLLELIDVYTDEQAALIWWIAQGLNVPLFTMCTHVGDCDVFRRNKPLEATTEEKTMEPDTKLIPGLFMSI